MDQRRIGSTGKGAKGEGSTLPRGLRHSKLVRVLLAPAALALSLLLLEAATRFASGLPDQTIVRKGADLQRRLYLPHPVLGTIHAADVDVVFLFPERETGRVRFRTNNLGLRRDSDTEVDPISGGEHRILVLGDSHTDGVVDNSENFCNLLEEGLERVSKQDWEVLNAGVGGYSPYQEYLWYRQFGRRLAPELVLWVVYTGNDFAEMVSPGRPVLAGSRAPITPPPQPSLLRRLHFWFVDHSSAYSKMMSLFPQSTGWTGAIGKAFDACPGCTGQYLAQLDWFRGQGSASWTAAERDFRETTRLLSSAVAAGGGRAVLVLLPSAHSVDPDFESQRLRAASQAIGIDPDWESLEGRIRETAIRIAEDEGVSVLDLLPFFTRHGPGSARDLYYRTDWHLDTAGHRAAAGTLAEFVLSDPGSKEGTGR